MQWVPGHSDIEGNKEADQVAKEACNMDQDADPIEISTLKIPSKDGSKNNGEKLRRDENRPFRLTSNGRELIHYSRSIKKR